LARLGPPQSPAGSQEPGRQKAADALVAGVITPLVMHSTLALAATALRVLRCGLLAWVWVRRRVT
jgi:hypothetical protein